jgi:predicted AlkP superfamily pyrophosphatase or phosphodiesterase
MGTEMKLKDICYLIVGALFWAQIQNASAVTSPQVTVVIVIDQFAYHYTQKLSPYFLYGFRQLLDSGVVFENALHPHGIPTTAIGHTTISTGALAKDHGVILNSWIENGKDTEFGKDEDLGSATLAKKGLMDYGFSAKHILVDTLSDQFVMNSRPYKKNYVYSISYKPRAAIGMAGKLGKAVWFDKNLKYFTSSKAYFDKIPRWLWNFNKTHNIKKIDRINWGLSYPPESEPYQFYNIKDYEFSRNNEQLAGRPIKIMGEKSDKIFQQTPESNNLLLHLAKKCIDFNFNRMNDDDKLLIWVSLSSLDRLGHIFGPYSIEVTDMIYHLDRQLDVFMHNIQDIVGAENVLFVLTADHGVAPIPEILRQEGFSSAKRLDSVDLQNRLNDMVEEKFGIKNIVQAFKTNHIYLNHKVKKHLDKNRIDLITAEIKKYLAKQDAIKICWTKEDLERAKFPKNYFEQLYKNQFYSKRSGDLIFMPQAYSSIIKHSKGTTHRSPFDYDTHVPIILYREGVLKSKKVTKKVYTTQIAATLAKMLRISSPSAASNTGLFEV